MYSHQGIRRMELEGVAPSTFGLQSRCSPAELQPHACREDTWLYSQHILDATPTAPVGLAPTASRSKAERSAVELGGNGFRVLAFSGAHDRKLDLAFARGLLPALLRQARVAVLRPLVAIAMRALDVLLFDRLVAVPAVVTARFSEVRPVVRLLSIGGDSPPRWRDSVARIRTGILTGYEPGGLLLPYDATAHPGFAPGTFRFRAGCAAVAPVGKVSDVGFAVSGTCWDVDTTGIRTTGRQGIAPCEAGFGDQPDPRSRPRSSPPRTCTENPPVNSRVLYC